MSYALAQWLQTLGLRPAALIGHSIGELAGACLAGVMSLDEAMRAVCARGAAMWQQPAGAMLAVRAAPRHGALAPHPESAEEVTLRVSVRGNDRAAVDYVGREFAPLILTGPPGATGFAGGRPKASAVAAYWSGLIPRDRVTPKVEVLSA
jgi:malonyl CoA-acyl carrier protein transacylase